MSPSVRAHDPSSRQALSPSEEVPVSFGSSPMTTSTAAPARNPVTTALERNCAIQPSLSSGEEEEQEAGQQRDRGDELRGLVAAETGDEDGAAGDRRERRARTGRDLPRRAEHRVDERSGRRCVEAVLERHPRDPRVAEVLRHDQRRDGDSRGDVAAQPAAVVLRKPIDDREEPAHGHDPRSGHGRAGAMRPARAEVRSPPSPSRGRAP